ncbi:MAG: SGNH/GDSL hydrolase family protein [Anaerolineae bacterium]
MKKLAPFILITVFSLFLIGNLQTSNAAERPATQTLYLLGDSWTQQAADDHGTFEKALLERGLADSIDVQSFAISGSTADEWANDNGNRLSNLTNAIKNDPLPNPVVFFTLGGNDLRDAFIAGPNPAAYDDIEADVRVVINALNASRSDIKIVMGGYDILNPDISPAICNFAANALFGSTDPAVVNPYVIQLYDTIKIVADDFDHVDAINTNGSLQGTPGNPAIDQWSPVGLIADCIHPNSAGYDLYIGTVFDQRLETLLMSTNTSASFAILLPFVSTGE